jgi:hypothetical protein
MKDKYQERPMIAITDKLWTLLDKIEDSPITWSIMDLDRNPIAHNPMRIQELDLGEKEFRINVKIANKYVPVKLSAFIKNYFGDGNFYQDEIDDFIERYNKFLKGSASLSPNSKKIDKKPFSFNPLDVRETFLSLVTETYPHGHEEEVVPLITPGLKKDSYGNYYTIIGESDCVFTCHLDTASRTKSGVNTLSFVKDGDEFIVTDGTSILGADDKAGVAVIMYMIAKNIPGVYWFFIGEERGGLGSRYVAQNIDQYPFMQGKTKCISFDRRNYYSVITKQMGVQCCSNDFGQQICDEMSKGGLKLKLDPTGVFTDSASFIDLIPECTNISVGYFDEHTHKEMLNVSYLERLCEASVMCDWNGMKATRKLMEESESYRKYKKLANFLKKQVFYNFDAMRGEDDRFIYEMEVTDTNPLHLRQDLQKLQTSLIQNGIDAKTQLIFDSGKIRIELQ